MSLVVRTNPTIQAICEAAIHISEGILFYQTLQVPVHVAVSMLPLHGSTMHGGVY